MSLNFDLSAADLINDQLQPSLKRKLEDPVEAPEMKKHLAATPPDPPLPSPSLPLPPTEVEDLPPAPEVPAAADDASPDLADPESAMAATLGHLHKSGVGFDFQLLDESSFEKIYEIMVLSSIIKSHPEIVTDLQINRTAIATLDDATRRHKFLECKLYVLIDLECQNMKALTGVFTALMRLVIHVVFPFLSKPTELVLNTSLANVDKKSNSLYYIHAVDAVKGRHFSPPNILYSVFTDMIKSVTMILTDYLLYLQQQKHKK